MFNQLNDLTREISPFNLLVVGVGNAGCNVLNAIEATDRPRRTRLRCIRRIKNWRNQR